MSKAKPTASDWREETLARMRRLILETDPEMSEERKWIKPTNPSGVPVWSHGGIVCSGEVYAKSVKLTFAQGASLPDPSRLFNSAWTAIRDGPSTFTKGRRSMRPHSRLS
jgi:hypothetical protein